MNIIIYFGMGIMVYLDMFFTWRSLTIFKNNKKKNYEDNELNPVINFLLKKIGIHRTFRIFSIFQVFLIYILSTVSFFFLIYLGMIYVIMLIHLNNNHEMMNKFKKITKINQYFYNILFSVSWIFLIVYGVYLWY